MQKLSIIYIHIYFMWKLVDLCTSETQTNVAYSINDITNPTDQQDTNKQYTNRDNIQRKKLIDIYCIPILTSSKSYWQVRVAAFPITTASGTKIFKSLRHKTEKLRKLELNNLNLNRQVDGTIENPEISRINPGRYKNKKHNFDHKILFNDPKFSINYKFQVPSSRKKN
jgi:hypothetical protein